MLVILAVLPTIAAGVMAVDYFGGRDLAPAMPRDGRWPPGTLVRRESPFVLAFLAAPA